MSEYPKKEFRIREMGIEGAKEFRSHVRVDNRGQFSRHFSKSMIGSEVVFSVAEANISRTIQKHTFRGMHYQIPPYAEAKLVSCLMGRVLDVIVDLRPQSQTYLQWESLLLSEELNNFIYVPMGVANGYLSLDENVLVHYYSSAEYSSAHERGFRFDDNIVKIELPNEPTAVSAKDRTWSDLSESDLEVFNEQF